MDITLPPSAKPQLLRASHEWCTENGYAPYLLVAVDGSVTVPREFVKDGQIVLNTSYDATAALQFDNEMISFRARFGGVAREISVPIARVLGLFARETGQGVYFEVSEPMSVKMTDASSQPASDEVPPETEPPAPKGAPTRPFLVRVK